MRRSHKFLQSGVSPRLASEDSTQPYCCANQHKEDFFLGLFILSPLAYSEGAGTSHP